MTGGDALARDYRAAFLRYIPRRDEVALASGYDLGRAAVTQEVSILEIARVHHDILLEVLADTRPADVLDVASAAADFLLEVLATYDMTQRQLSRSESRPLDPA